MTTGSEARETLTLQVGRYANFVGTHFWNFQDEVAVQWREGELRESYDQASLYREGRGLRGEAAPTPRLLVFDTRDGLGGMHPLGPLHSGGSASSSDAAATAVAWNRGKTLMKAEEYPKNDFLKHLEREYEDGDQPSRSEDMESAEADDGAAESGNFAEAHAAGVKRAHPFGLDDAVSAWSDFLKALTHPQTFQELPFRDANAGAFDSFSSAAPEQLGLDTCERYEDAVRRLLEEADAPQGAQAFSDARGGCLGLTTGLFRQLREECRGAALVCFITENETAENAPNPSQLTAAASAARAVNFGLALDALAEYGAVCSVLSSESTGNSAFPELSVDESRPYHTSAVLATAIDTATAPCRFGGELRGSYASRVRPMRISEWSAAAAVGWHGGGGSGVAMTELELCFPFPRPHATEVVLRELLVDPRVAAGAAGRNSGLSGLLAPLLPPLKCRQSPIIAEAWPRASQLLVARGLHLPKSSQIGVLEAALALNPASSSSSRAAVSALSTPLAIPLSFPAIFRSAAGGGGNGSGSGSSSGAATAFHATGGSQEMLRARPARHVLRDSASVLASAGATWRLTHFCAEILESFSVERPLVKRALERAGMQLDDALEAQERLRGVVAACPGGSALLSGGSDDDDDF